jgi:preprotein translocase subunit YajC
MLHAFIILAQEGAKESGGGGGGILQSPYLPFLLILVMALYFFIVILPGKRRAEREAQEKLKKLEKGTEVLTIGGIYGTVISVHPEKDEIVVKVDDGTRLRMTKNSIARNITAEEAAKKAKEAKSAPAPTTAVTTTPAAQTPKN